MGDYEKAAKYYKMAVDEDPDFIPAWNNLGTLYTRTKRYKKAIKCFINALNIDPSSVVPLNNLGYLYYRLGRYDEALKYLKQAVSLQTRDEDILLNYWRAYDDFLSTYFPDYKKREKISYPLK